MTTDKQKATNRNSPQLFIDSFDDFCVGLVDLKHMRALITELLESDPQSGEIIIETIDSAFREGLIKASTYEVLIMDIDRVTSEDEPTEWSEETREQYSEEFEDSVFSSSDETGHPIEQEQPDAIRPAAVPNETTPGTILKNRFELVSRIGGGSMSDIFEAIDRRKQEAGSTDPRLAIKVISRAFSQHAHALEAFQREAVNSQGLIHPNIIRVFDFDRDGDRCFMTMELLHGQPLVEVLKKTRFRPMPFNQALSIIQGMCNGLQHAHEQGIVHADIKPGNIFVSPADKAKILDFGIARITDDDSEKDGSPVTGAHTPAYSSCEVLEGDEPTVQDDIFAMGCVAYRILAGRRAFGGLTALDAERKKIEPVRIESLNPQQWDALKKSLAFRHTDRTANIGDFTAAFFSAAPTRRATDEPDIQVSNLLPGGLPLKYGISAIAALLIAIVLALFWPEPEPVPVAIFEPVTPTPFPALDEFPPVTTADESVEPAVSATNDEEPISVATKEPEILPVGPQPDLQPATPIQPEPAPSRMDELAVLADNAMNEGRLLDPADDNAQLHITEMSTLEPDAPQTQQRRTRLTDLILLEAMVAITDENFEGATRWISETRTLGAPEETLQRFEAELQKARDAQKTRQNKSIGAIFASATPAAILANPEIDFESEQAVAAEPETVTTNPEAGTGPMTGPGSLSLAMMMPGALPDNTANMTDKVPPNESVDNQNQDVPLSELKFDLFVEPELPRRFSSRRMSGWVELRFRVTANGRTDNITVLAAEPDHRFEKAAITAVSKWRFKPVFIDGIAAEKYSSVRLRFQP